MLDILVADDSKFARKRLIDNLNKLDIEHKIVAQAKDGLEALEMFKHHIPNLVITDIEMPKMDGIQFIQQLRRLNRSVDIVVVSSVENKQLVQSLKSDPHTKFVSKPIELDVLGLILQKVANRLSEEV